LGGTNFAKIVNYIIYAMWLHAYDVLNEQTWAEVELERIFSS